MNNLSVPAILSSKRFITVVVLLLFELFVLWIPGIEAFREQVLEAGVLALLALVGSFTGQDWIAAARGTSTKYFDPKAPASAPVG